MVQLFFSKVASGLGLSSCHILVILDVTENQTASSVPPVLEAKSNSFIVELLVLTM